jgi:hypothetical protein
MIIQGENPVAALPDYERGDGRYEKAVADVLIGAPLLHQVP